jgi:hypothetical protein
VVIHKQIIDSIQPSLFPSNFHRVEVGQINKRRLFKNIIFFTTPIYVLKIPFSLELPQHNKYFPPNVDELIDSLKIPKNPQHHGTNHLDIS